MVSKDQAMLDWAVVTPSYIGDLQRCNLLCESMEAFLHGAWHHYVIVDRRELHLFSHLNGPRRTVLVEQEILPREIKYLGRLPFGRKLKLWWSRQTGFMGGWQIQQLLKLKMAYVVKQDAMLMCDSDTFFIRPFNISTWANDGVIRFYRSDWDRPEMEGEDLTKFSNAAFKVLGLEDPRYPVNGYVDNMIPWHAPTVRKACDYVTSKQGKPWYLALGRITIFSEYTLYGLYVDRVAQNKTMLAPTHETICYTIWVKDDEKLQTLETTIESLPPNIVAVGVQSNLGTDPQIQAQLYRKIIERQI
jgi:Family of unknown function (DUF6492)